MIAYKLFRKLKSGKITSLFINKTRALPFGEWLQAENHPTKGYANRPFWHATESPHAPHLSENGRIWIQVEIEDFEIVDRPQNQGGRWYLANRIKLLKDEK